MEQKDISQVLTSEPVYVWQFPVRMYHWINMFAIIALCITGYLIGNPLAVQSSAEANFSYWFGTVRFIHFIAAFVFFFNFVYRLYWGFAGNRYAKWYNYFPFTKKQLNEIVDVLKVDVLQVSNKHIESIGHNALADLSYLITFLAFLVQSFTGFGLYAAMSTSWFPDLFSWIVPLLGGDLLTRHIHHIFMWVFILFAIVHIYLVFYHDYIEKRGITSSMIGGWKFIEKERFLKLLDQLKKQKKQ